LKKVAALSFRGAPCPERSEGSDEESLPTRMID
jgi:hypothetical protein